MLIRMLPSHAPALAALEPPIRELVSRYSLVPVSAPPAQFPEVAAAYLAASEEAGFAACSQHEWSQLDVVALPDGQPVLLHKDGAAGLSQGRAPGSLSWAPPQRITEVAELVCRRWVEDEAGVRYVAQEFCARVANTQKATEFLLAGADPSAEQAASLIAALLHSSVFSAADGTEGQSSVLSMLSRPVPNSVAELAEWAHLLRCASTLEHVRDKKFRRRVGAAAAQLLGTWCRRSSKTDLNGQLTSSPFEVLLLLESLVELAVSLDTVALDPPTVPALEPDARAAVHGLVALTMPAIGRWFNAGKHELVHLLGHARVCQLPRMLANLNSFLLAGGNDAVASVALELAEEAGSVVERCALAPETETNSVAYLHAVFSFRALAEVSVLNGPRWMSLALGLCRPGPLRVHFRRIFGPLSRRLCGAVCDDGVTLQTLRSKMPPGNPLLASLTAGSSASDTPNAEGTAELIPIADALSLRWAGPPKSDAGLAMAVALRVLPTAQLLPTASTSAIRPQSSLLLRVCFAILLSGATSAGAAHGDPQVRNTTLLPLLGELAQRVASASSLLILTFGSPHSSEREAMRRVAQLASYRGGPRVCALAVDQSHLPRLLAGPSESDPERFLHDLAQSVPTLGEKLAAAVQFPSLCEANKNAVGEVHPQGTQPLAALVVGGKCTMITTSAEGLARALRGS